MLAPLIDTHCHLDMQPLAADVDAVLTRAEAAGVVQCISIGCAHHVDDVDVALQIAKARPGRVFASTGVHPHDAAGCNAALLDAIARTGSDPACVAIGETGLDYHYDHSPRAQQQEAFRQHIALAKALDKPLIVHTRSAADDTLRILAEEGARDVGGVIHCFSEDAVFAARALDLGFVASFSGIVTFKKATAIRDAAARQPADALLVETDAPYLAPVPHRGKTNEPAFVQHTAACIAQLRGMDIEELGAWSTANARRVFRLPAP
ncbi:MAG: TatD family hydrolase [Polyangiales bacterium]